jgi:GR25 family glycosyltransferase involved in LPS biosynthesis
MHPWNLSFLLSISIILFVYTITITATKHLQNSCSIEPSAFIIKPYTVSSYVINMTKNHERLNNFSRSYNNHIDNIPLIRFNAINGRTIQSRDYVSVQTEKKLRLLDRTGLRTHHSELTRGATGCYLSHMGVYNKIANGSKEYGLIFEDDAFIEPNFFCRLNKSLSKIPYDWDIILLNCRPLDGDYSNNEYTVINRFFGLYGYLIKKSAAQKIYNYLANCKIKQQLDWELSDIASDGLLNIYSCNDNIVTHPNAETTIQAPVSNSNYSYSWSRLTTRIPLL